MKNISKNLTHLFIGLLILALITVALHFVGIYLEQLAPWPQLSNALNKLDVHGLERSLLTCGIFFIALSAIFGFLFTSYVLPRGLGEYIIYRMKSHKNAMNTI